MNEGMKSFLQIAEVLGIKIDPGVIRYIETKQAERERQHTRSKDAEVMQQKNENRVKTKNVDERPERPLPEE